MEPNSREHQRQAIDAEIKSLEESIQVLKYRRNALALVSSLPTEIIGAIFSFACPMPVVSAPSATPGKKPDPLAWRRVSHVCHQWREIALNQPLFWSHINITDLGLAAAAEILARAKTAPLYLEARALCGHWDDARYSSFQEILQMCICRTCYLHISANMCDLLKILDSLVSPAPTLESLSLRSKRDFLQPAVPDNLFSGATPSLSFLKLCNCNISWKSPLLKGLITLEIRFPSSTVIPSLSVWLDALDEMPQLKMLTLYIASPVASSFPFDVERTVTLPSLTHFDIANSPRDCALALAHLKLPTLTCLCISCMLDDDNVQEVIPYVAGYARMQPLRSMFIWCKNRRMHIFTSPVPDIDVEEDETPTLSTTTPLADVAFSLWSRDRFENHLEFLGTVMAALPLDGLITLIAQDFRAASFEKFWLHNSLKWPVLRRVRLTPFVATKFTDWLLADEGGCEDPLLPSLKELVLVGAKLDKHLTDELCDLVMKRVEHGVPLEMLDLRTCSPDPANPGAVQLLGEIVADVLGPEETLDARAHLRSMWDGDGRDESESDQDENNSDSEKDEDDEELE